MHFEYIVLTLLFWECEWLHFAVDHSYPSLTPPCLLPAYCSANGGWQDFDKTSFLLNTTPFKEADAYCTDWWLSCLSFAACSAPPCLLAPVNTSPHWIIGSLYAPPYFPCCSCVHFVGQMITGTTCFHVINNTVVSSCLCLMKYRMYTVCDQGE